MRRNMLLLFLLALITAQIGAQTTAEPVRSKADEKLENDAVALLRETLVEVNGMRSAENRISFKSELAGLMWFHDEREARAMYMSVTTEFRDLLHEYDMQMNSYGISDTEQVNRNRFDLFLDPTDAMTIERKSRTAVAVRQQVTMSMAEHDPDLAYAFYYDSLSSITNPRIRSAAEDQGKYFETQLIGMIADKNPEKALKFAKKSIESGVSYQHLDILRKLYAKDADKAADLAADMLARIKSDKPNVEDLWVVSSLVSFGAETLTTSRSEGGKKAIYSQSDLNDLVDVMAKAILDQPAENPGPAAQYLPTIEKYQLGRAAQIRAKFKIQKRSTGIDPDYASNTISYSSNSNRSNSSYASSMNSNMSNTALERDRQEAEQKQMMDNVAKIGKGQLTKDQRDEIVAQARKIIATTPGRDKKVVALGMLATQVAAAGDKDLSAEIMKDARALVNPQPVTYQDFLLTWMLASGYAAADPDKAFPLLDDAISRANDTIGAFIKVGEFIDVNGEMIADGELQVGAFGGSMVRDLTRQLGVAESGVTLLAKADFAKTRDLTNRFDRPEVRVLAKMMVLRAVLGPKQKDAAANKPDISEDMMN